MLLLKRLSIAAVLAGAAMTTTACVSTDSLTVYESGSIEGPRVVALVGQRRPWTVEIESRLRDRGYTVRRFPSVAVVYEEISETRAEVFNEASARVILVVDGHAPNTSMTRCFGGGYRFSYIEAELIDTAENETLAYYANSGHSENCPPVSGTIFTDIVWMVDSVFAN